MLCLSFTTSVLAQNTFLPYSSLHRVEDNLTKHQKNISLSKSISRTLSEDQAHPDMKYIERYAVTEELGYSPGNSGVWTELANNDKLWRLTIKSPGAKFVNLVFDKFHLPPGGLLHFYDSNKSQIIGGYTSANNLGSPSQPGGYASGIINGDEITIEYYQPKNVDQDLILDISKISHGIKPADIEGRLKAASYNSTSQQDPSLNSSGSCQVNINCSEGNNWKNEKRGVAVFFNQVSFCSGSLVNNTSENGVPYFLTADHCLGNNDVITNPNASGWVFYWNYEHSGCANNSSRPPLQSTVGATVVANDDNSDNLNNDFALLRLSESPVTKGFNVYFNGWDRTQSPSAGGVMIHHPRVDVKKIATYSVVPLPSQQGFTPANWDIRWVATQNGHSVSQGGSSGSSLISNNRRILGVLSKQNTPFGTECANASQQISTFARFHSMWDNPNSTKRRLKNWLDPSGTNRSYINGKRFYPATVNLTITYLESDFEMYISASASGGTSPYRWYINGTLRGTTTGPSFSYRYRCQGGTSTIGVISNNGGSDTESYYEDCNGRSNKTAVYPNPASSEINIVSLKKGEHTNVSSNDDSQSRYGDMVVEVLDMNGQKIMHREFKSYVSERKIDVDNLKKGIYFIRIVARELDETHQIIVE